MSSSLVFNDASLPFQSEDECSKCLPVFFNILKEALKNQVKTIRTNQAVGSDWYHFFYATDFSLSRWINSQSDLDYKRSLKTIMAKTACPLIFSEEQELLATFESSSFQLIENSIPVPAIGSAFLLDIPVVSFLSMPCWYQQFISIKHEYIDEENDCIQEVLCNIENISQSSHLANFFEKIQSDRQQSHAYLKELTEFDNDDFPNLIFCKSVLDNFKQACISSKLLAKLIEVLTCLNQTTASSVSEIIETADLSISGESNTTKNNPKLLKYRKFQLPDNGLFTFDLHVKNFPNGQRLYFHPDFQTKKIYVGYFGNHLPT